MQRNHLLTDVKVRRIRKRIPRQRQLANGRWLANPAARARARSLMNEAMRNVKTPTTQYFSLCVECAYFDIGDDDDTVSMSTDVQCCENSSDTVECDYGGWLGGNWRRLRRAALPGSASE